MMVMETTQTEDSQVNKYPQDIPSDYPQHNQSVDSNVTSKKPNAKSESANSKIFPPPPDTPGNVTQRQFGPGFNEGMQRPGAYPDGGMPGSVEQPHYPQSSTMSSSNNTALAASTPTLNQLLTQNPHPPKYPSGGYGGEYPSSANPNSAVGSNSPAMYDGWNAGQQNTPNPSMYPGGMPGPARPGMPPPNRPMAPHSMQMGGMYDRAGQPMHPAYRHPGSQFGPPAGSPNYRMVGNSHHPGYNPHSVPMPMDPSHGSNDSSDGDNSHAGSAHQRSRSSMMAAPGRMMGPPRAPGPHQMDTSGGQMMPPPNQGQGYPGMHPYGSQPYRNNPMPPYSNYPSNQTGTGMSRGQPPSGFPQNPMNHQSMVGNQSNGPHKAVPSSVGQPMSQPSPGSSRRGISPAPNQQMGLAPSPASSTGAGQAQGKAVSPCPSPSVRSMPPSPASASMQLNSPHPGMSPRPESVASPRTDMKADTHAPASHPSTVQAPVNSTQPSISEPSTQSNGQPSEQPNMAPTHPQASLPPQQQHMMMSQQQHPRMPNSTGMPPGASHPGMPPGAPHPGMGNGMPPYAQQRMPLGQSYPPQNRAAAPGSYPPSAQYPPNQAPPPHMAYPGANSSPSWPPPQQSHQQPHAAGGVYSTKNDKNAVSSPLSAAQSPAAVASPHGSEGSRRPSSRKSDSSGGGSKTQKVVGANTVHGTSLDVFNKQVELGPPAEHPMRRQFMDHLCAFYLETSKPLTSMPCIGKNPLDLYKVFQIVKEKGGFQQVCKKKLWKLVGTTSAASTAANAAYTMKKAYIKFLLNYECKFEQGGIDPQVVLSSVETKKDKQNRNAPSPGSSGNSQDGHMRGYSDYNMGPGVHHPGHPVHMGAGQMRPTQYHDPNMPPHPQQHSAYMNYNNMGGHGPSGPMPNGHHPMTPQQPNSVGNEDQLQMSGQSDPNADPYRHQPMNSQFNNQPNMSGPGYPPRHPYYGPRMPPPGGQRPPFHQQPTPSPSSQQQPPPSPQMRMPHPQSGYPPMYRDSGYPNSQAGMPSTPSSHSSSGYPSMDSQSSRTPSSVYSQSPTVGAVPSHLPTPSAAPSSNMSHSMQPQHSSPVTPVPRYPPRGPHQTMSRGALGSMLSSSSGAPGIDTHPPLESFTESLSFSYEGGFSGARTLEMPPPPLPMSTLVDLTKDMRSGMNMPWRPRASMPPPGYPGLMGADHPMPRRPMPRHSMAPPKKEVEFPAGSVEATQPSKVRRRVLHASDVGKVDARKLVMCLRSGLLYESVWALDTITILLRDEQMHAMRFCLRNMPGLLDILIAHYKQSLALMFEELSGMAETEPISCSSLLDEEEYDLEDCKEAILNSANYSWTSRGGMKVIVDSDLKQGQMIPSPSMYSRKAYTNHKKDHTVVTTYEPDNTKDFYNKHFRKYVKVDKKYGEGLTTSISTDGTFLKEDDMTTINSPTPTSPTSGGTEFSAQSTQTEKRMLMDGGISQFPVCNGFITPDLKGDMSEHSCESSDAALSTKSAVDIQTKSDTGSKSKDPMEQKMVESTEGLKILEAKLTVSRKRRFSENMDETPLIRDRTPLEGEVDRKLEELAVRCTTLSNIFRGFSFIPENEKLMADNQALLGVFGQLLKLKTKPEQEKEQKYWLWSSIEALRENTLVAISNIAGHIQLMKTPNEVCYPLMDSLLFWSTTSSAYARDPLPHTHSLSIRNLAMEILCKMCAHAENMNLLLATPPVDRISRLFQCLARLLAETDQVRREFALVIISCLAQADPAAARGLAVQPSCVSQLISILESAETAAYSIAQQRGVSALRENPEAMGTSLDMIRRTSGTLVEMAQVEENHAILLRQQDRLLNLVMSQILDQHVAKMLSDVLYECTKKSQLDIAPSYIISSDTGMDDDGVEDMDDGRVDNSPTTSVHETDASIKSIKKEDGAEPKNISEAHPIKHEPELDKENINKSSLIESNSTLGMISAAS